MGYTRFLMNQKTTLKRKCQGETCLASEFDNIFYKTTHLKHVASGIIPFYTKFSSLLEARKITDHVPIAELPKHINSKLIEKKINTIHQSLIADFKINKPKIAVLGLNPHSGDNGVIGKEDDEIVKPSLEKIFKSGIQVFGPFSADSFFGSNQYKNYDAVVAMYHDQGLIPFKTLSFGEGVNFTAGLNKVRTSPDHGTGFDIAGKNIANESSFREAVYSAIDIYKNRMEYNELTHNPLKKGTGKV